jgi:D-3-phosphoglycerate dehydrogenase
MTRKRVGIQLGRQAQSQSVEERFALELEGLAPVADIVEIRADSPAEFAAGVADVDAIITSWGLRIDAQVIAALKQCVVIGVGSVGVDMVDIAAATAAGIVVTNVPDVFIEEVADHAMMLLLDVARRTPMMARMARDGQWYQARPILSRTPRLLGQTLGLYAFGNVARCTARRAQAFGLRVIAHDPYVSELEITAAGVEPVGFGELLERSDYLSIHAPHNDETEHAIDAAALARMKPGALLVNTARGPLCDYAALYDALAAGALGGAMLETFAVEPTPPDWPLLRLPNVTLTPHIAGASSRTVARAAEQAAEEVRRYLAGEPPLNPC